MGLWPLALLIVAWPLPLLPPLLRSYYLLHHIWAVPTSARKWSNFSLPKKCGTLSHNSKCAILCICVCVLNVFFFFDGKFGGREYDSLVGQFDSSGNWVSGMWVVSILLLLLFAAASCCCSQWVSLKDREEGLFWRRLKVGRLEGNWSWVLLPRGGRGIAYWLF